MSISIQFVKLTDTESDISKHLMDGVDDGKKRESGVTTMPNYYDNIKEILVTVSDEPCKVDIELMHKALLSLPAGLYLELYEHMHNSIFNRTKEGVDNAE